MYKEKSLLSHRLATLKPQFLPLEYIAELIKISSSPSSTISRINFSYRGESLQIQRTLFYTKLSVGHKQMSKFEGSTL